MIIANVLTRESVHSYKFKTSMDREVTAVGEAMLNLTDVGGFWQMER